MKSFGRLYTSLDETTATNEKISALVEYFRRAPAADAVWAIHFLSGQRPKRLVSTAKLRVWAAAEAAIPDWLFEESYHAVGDLAETITLLLPDTGGSTDLSLAEWVETRLLPLRGQEEAVQRTEMVRAWRELNRQERYVWNKLITGSFRVGASARMVERALAQVSGLSEGVIAHRLMGAWEPTAKFFGRLTAPDVRDTDTSRPYPFFLAYALDQEPADLGPIAEWGAEWKWDGIRGQLIRRDGRTFLWSRGEELLNGRFPEVEEVASLLPDGTVLDGELLRGWGSRRCPLPSFSAVSAARRSEGSCGPRCRWCWSRTISWKTAARIFAGVRTRSGAPGSPGSSITRRPTAASGCPRVSRRKPGATSTRPGSKHASGVQRA